MQLQFCRDPRRQLPYILVYVNLQRGESSGGSEAFINFHQKRGRGDILISLCNLLLQLLSPQQNPSQCNSGHQPQYTGLNFWISYSFALDSAVYGRRVYFVVFSGGINHICTMRNMANAICTVLHDFLAGKQHTSLITQANFVSHCKKTQTACSGQSAWHQNSIKNVLNSQTGMEKATLPILELWSTFSNKSLIVI